MAAPAFLADLDRRAAEAQAEEVRFRKSFAEEVARRERGRAFAFRRAGLMARMVRAASTEDDEAARTAQLAAFCMDLGWQGTTETQEQVLTEWAKVADAVQQALTEGEADPLAALAAFETWYEKVHGVPFLAVFDQDPIEIPLVEG